MTTFEEYCLLQEAIGQPVENLQVDLSLKTMLAMGYPHLKDVNVVYDDSMVQHGLRVLSFRNPSGVYELHLHNNFQMPGTRVDAPNHRAMLSALKIMHAVAKQHVEGGHRVQIQVGPDGTNYDKYHSLAKRLVAQTGHKITEVGNQPLASMPSYSGKAFVIENVQT